VYAAAESSKEMQITSQKNPLLQGIRKAAMSGRTTEDGLVVAEGPHLLGEALRGTWEIEQVLVTEASRLQHSELLSAVQADVIEVSERAFAATSATQTHQGVITLLRPRPWSWSDLLRGGGIVVVLDGIQDPGNGGTILRSAEAFGAAGVIFLHGSVHVTNGKFLRAAAGSTFRVPLLEHVTAESLVHEAKKNGFTLYALAATGEQSLSEVNLSRSAALVLGSEGSGISPAIARAAASIRIPIENVESLNVAVAGSIALFEAARQRSFR
jgi:RNA methyltransferase, TrmH family